MTDTSAFTRHIEFRRNFLAAKSATERGELCREHLAHFKVPHSFSPVVELPKTATGKIQKFVLRKGRPNLAAQ